MSFRAAFHIVLILVGCRGWQALSAQPEPRLPSGNESRPNFLFVYTDDQRWDGLSICQKEEGDSARFPWIRTPNMDRLAAEGVRFRNAFVTNSLCAPSRATFLTGKYSHLNGVANNHTPLPEGSVTHASLLQKAGYVTGYVGKWHMDGQRGQRPGFDYSASFVGQGRYQDCPFEINGEEKPTKGWVDDVSGDFAVDFLKKNQAKPFLLCVGFKSSHGPWEPAERFKNLYAGEVAKPAPNASSPAIYKRGAAPATQPATKGADALPPGARRSCRRQNAGNGQGWQGRDDSQLLPHPAWRG